MNGHLFKSIIIGHSMLARISEGDINDKLTEQLVAKIIL